MSSFTGEIDVRMTPDRDQGRVVWELLTPVFYEVGFVGSNDIIILPPGVRTDGASIPIPISWFVPVLNFKTFLPSALHDELLRKFRAGDRSRTRKQIDKIFHEALRVKRTNAVLAQLFYIGVRLNALLRQER